MKEFTVSVVGKASDYAVAMGYPACYISPHTIITVFAETEKEASEIGWKFGRVAEVKEEKGVRRIAERAMGIDEPCE